MEQRWLSLTKSYEVSERLTDFSGSRGRQGASAKPKKTGE
jgi:hypothetical protein